MQRAGSGLRPSTSRRDVCGNHNATFPRGGFFQDGHSSLAARDSFQRSLPSQALFSSQFSALSALHWNETGVSNYILWMYGGRTCPVDLGTTARSKQMQECRFTPLRYANKAV
ncbi:hypothetical protein TraAM80_04033 [Trypanosoma rangeli]|uniref:Uncharacterized protein n=1 Tax=Trypanosoma rangeli TaxID=5698 RepID=A0A3R7LZK0_TRYRA|nr:uncharacterized protein TraAM80_04033 [Trypanosoma rangeli]RNF06336.1 hypothetical protein TraAM80_04033 [Trypanosoma rangeli]|eukprot:RNF06336.1 hypothetical protein TraAM80_04033 [Trypanosoma rangeli]